MTTRWIKLITTIGLFLMTTEMQRERMNRIFTGNTEISGEALAELIDECKNTAGAFLEEHKDSQAISEEQNKTIREMLERIDGKTEVATIGLTEDIGWLLELREKINSTGITVADLKQSTSEYIN